MSPAEAPQSLPDVLAPSSGRLGYGSYGPPQPGILTHRIHVWYIYLGQPNPEKMQDGLANPGFEGSSQELLGSKHQNRVLVGKP